MYFRRMVNILNHTGAIKIFLAYICALCVASFLLIFIEPEVDGFFEGVYFCFVASTTIGFGDIVPVTVFGRIITILITIAGILTIAVVPGVIVAYYTEYLKIREKETISTFLEKLEKLPELSKEELTDLSNRVKQFEKRNRL